MIASVWVDHIIQPNALLGPSGKANNKNATTTASGKDPTPPLVAAILKLAKIKPTKIAPIGMLWRSDIDWDVM